jgi:hypothetical protein
MFHSALAVAAHNDLLAEAMRLVNRRLAPLRDLYMVGDEQVSRIADVHARQVHALRAREDALLEEVLDEHFRMLEEGLAFSLGQPWDRLFGPDARKTTAPFEPPWRKLASLTDEYHPHGWRTGRGVGTQ